MSSPSKSSANINVSLRPIEVPKAMQEGEKFIKWDEQDSGGGIPVTLRVDPNGFYLYWTDQNMEVEMLDISNIRDVRTGVHAKVPKDPKIRHVVLIGSQGLLEEKTVTVCYGADFVNVTFINFCCTRKEIAQMWTESLFQLAYNLNQMTNPTIKFLEKLHTKIVLKADKTGKIVVKNIVRMFAQNKEDKKRVEKALSESGLPTSKNDTINQSKFLFEDFFAFYKNLTQRNEVQKIFNSLTDGKPHLSALQLVDFLNEIQRDPRLNEILHPYADLHRAKDLIRAYEHNKYHQQRLQLTFDGFLRFLMSEDNPIVATNKLDLCDDMDQPLAHYFVNSSHNTYLTGHQITGKSSVEIYRQSLLAGCRCVELDFWNGRTDEPIIVHGYTFVPEISAKEVLEAIAESAFKTSDYPVILSFENHCNPRQQAKIAHYCHDIFGDMLLDRPLDSHQLEPGGKLPPPSMLRRKIIIKNKKKHHHHHKKEDSVASEEAELPELPTAQGNGEIPHESLARQGSKESSESSDSESSSGEEEAAGPEAGAGEEKRETHAGAEISALVNYVQPVHFSSFENSKKKNRFYEMSSFDEKQATTLLKERPVEFVNYNKHQLSRVYPAGTRFDSSNFMPQVFWNAGCQLVALNYQTLDLAMQLNLGTFEYNRRCGYLLKPEFMRRKDRRLDPFAESTVDGIIAGSLSVTILSGQLLTDKRCGTYVEVDMFGLPADTVRKKFRTKVVSNNGINPVYGDEPFVFKKVVLPELAMIRIAAHEESGRLLGHRVLPVVGLCPGYRHVNLRTELGLPLPASLLLLVVVKDYVPDRLSELAEALANPIKYQSELDKREHQLAVLTDGTDVHQKVSPKPKHAAPVQNQKSSAVDGSSSKTSKAISESKTLNESEKLPGASDHSVVNENKSEDASLPSVPDEKESEGASLPSAVNEKASEGESLPSAVNENASEGASLPSAVNEKASEGESLPYAVNENASEGASLPSAVNENASEGASLPSAVNEKGSEGASLPSAVNEKASEGASLPSAANEKGSEGASLPAVVNEKDSQGAPTPAPKEKELTEEEKKQAAEEKRLAAEKQRLAAEEKFIQETLNALFESKVVREKKAELARKLEALRRKQEKEKKSSTKFYVSNKLVKRLSSKNIPVGESSGGSEECGAEESPERSLRLRYHYAIYAAIEKLLHADHLHRMKTLSELMEVQKKEILNRLANSRKEDVKALAKKTNRDKDEILRIKREIHAQSVERGVAECSLVEKTYAAKREELARMQERLFALIQKDNKEKLQELNSLCDAGREV